MVSVLWKQSLINKRKSRLISGGFLFLSISV